MQDSFNCPSTYGKLIKAGREVVGSKGLFITKKRYAIKIYDLEGNKTDKIKLLQTPILGIKEDTGNSTGVIEHSYKSLKEFKEKLFVGCPVNTPSMVFSYELYEKGLIEWNSKEFFGAADYDLYFNLANSNLFI